MSPIAQLIRSHPRTEDARLPRPAALGLTDPERDASARAMKDMLRRGCGVSDILERLAQPNDSAAERLARTLHPAGAVDRDRPAATLAGRRRQEPAHDGTHARVFDLADQQAAHLARLERPPTRAAPLSASRAKRAREPCHRPETEQL